MQTVQQTTPLELWGGLECTVNRVGDQYFDQTVRTGHEQREDDLERFAELGLRTLRYPVLWERIMPGDTPDWSWTDARLNRMRELGITPILGLVHHGSGPRHTSLLDPFFPEKLAHFAGMVAERYPWATMYTPVNEPLTTARFSALYGHWYPHARDDHSFARALLNQCRGVALAMQAIRQVAPHAQLVQTDDLGKTFSTPHLAYQAAFENERRWVTFDLLCGRITHEHPLWSYLRWVGIGEEDLEWFARHPCPPDIIGLNYYLSSERFLDERLERYPARTHGGNHRDRYADVEVARVSEVERTGVQGLLAEAWDRYHMPLAITESHNGCTREEQIRWLREVWNAANQARGSGTDVRAVTVWALLGNFDWCNLVTRDAGQYEPGVFDVRDRTPRPTALAHVTRALATNGDLSHPVLAGAGWWQRPLRVLFGERPQEQPMRRVYSPRQSRRGRSSGAPPLLISGATGTLGMVFARLCELRGLPYYLLSRAEMDIANAGTITTALDSIQPWAVINTAGYVRVDDAEREPERCMRENAAGPARLAELCATRDIPLVTFSSDLVFGGGQRVPYLETNPTNPLNVYGFSKAQAEERVLALHEGALVVRTSAFFSPWDAYNFVTIARQHFARGMPFAADNESTISPTYVPDLVNACLDLLIDGETGVWHLANRGALTWSELARQVALADGFDPNLVDERSASECKYVAARPTYSVLGSVHGALLPSLDDALGRYFDECMLELSVGV